MSKSQLFLFSCSNVYSCTFEYTWGFCPPRSFQSFHLMSYVSIFSIILSATFHGQQRRPLPFHMRMCTVLTILTASARWSVGICTSKVPTRVVKTDTSSFRCSKIKYENIINAPIIWLVSPVESSINDSRKKMKMKSINPTLWRKAEIQPALYKLEPNTLQFSVFTTQSETWGFLRNCWTSHTRALCPATLYK